LSLLWKPVDIDLPPRVSGYEVSTLEIKSLAATNLVGNAEKGMAVSLETDTDRFTLYSGDAYDNGKSTITLEDAQAELPQTPSAFDDLAELTEVEWDIQRPIRLAVEYRHSCSVLLSFVVRTGVLKKKKVLAIGSVRLTDCADNEECTRTIPIFGTNSVKDAVHAAQLFEKMQGQQQQQQQQQEQQPLKSDRPLSAATVSSVGSARSGPPTPSRDSGAVQQTRLVGFASIRFAVRPGVSRAHKRLAKKDMRFKHVYEAWEAEREVKIGLDKMGMRDAVRKEKEGVMKRESALAKKGRSGEAVGAAGAVGGVDNGENGREEMDSESESGTSSDESDEDGQGQGRPRRSASTSGKSLASAGVGTKAVGGDGSESAEEDLGVEGFGSERRAHAHALHKRVSGAWKCRNIEQSARRARRASHVATSRYVSCVTLFRFSSVPASPVSIVSSSSTRLARLPSGRTGIITQCRSSTSRCPMSDLHAPNPSHDAFDINHVPFSCLLNLQPPNRLALTPPAQRHLPAQDCPDRPVRQRQDRSQDVGEVKREEGERRGSRGGERGAVEVVTTRGVGIRG
jgi:hypothetical protein